jgi:hypothetical protein
MGRSNFKKSIFCQLFLSSFIRVGINEVTVTISMTKTIKSTLRVV